MLAELEGGGDEAAQGGDGFLGEQMAAVDTLCRADAAQSELELVALDAWGGGGGRCQSPVLVRAPPVAAAPDTQVAAATDRAPAAAASGAHAAVWTDAAPRAKLEVDLALVQRFLDTKDWAAAGGLWGQDSFYELYSILFSKLAVYVLVFNMEWLLPSSPDREEGLVYQLHWLGAHCGVYCRNTCIMLMGTHKDRVREPCEHELISRLLYEQLLELPSWP
jgi:hypothetical protein